VGKGFVSAEEETTKLITSVCEDKRIQAKLLEASDHSRLAVTREMGEVGLSNCCSCTWT